MRSSLKFKILILLSSICLGSGALIISVAINAFRNDKLAYIFENYTETLKNTSNLFQSEYSTAKNEIRLFMYQYGQNTNLKLDDQDFIDEKYTVDFVGIKQKINTIQDFQTIQKKSYEKLFTTKILPSLRIIFAKFENNGKEAELIGNQIFLFDQQLEGENESKLLYSFKPRSLENFLKSEDDSLNFVVDESGNILKQNSLIETTRIDNPFDDNIKKIAKESQFRISTQTITDANRKRYLLTVSPLKVSNLFLVKIIEEEKAFSILNTFLYKVILAFLFLSCFVIIISVLSATYLTKRLVILSKFTKEISAGNFSHQIPITGKDEISSLSDNFNKMSHEIVRLLDETSKKNANGI
jgi:HAMP domain-containing protein